MSNMGMGIGSFISGLAGGLNVVHEWEKDAAYNDYLKRRTDLLDSEEKRAAAKDARDAANDAQDRQWKTQDRATAEAERLANAPLINAKRESAINELSDAASERSAKRAAGEAAVAGFKADPKRYGSFEEAFRAVALPKVQEFYLSKGDTASADAFKTWADKQEIRDGIENVGRLNQAFARGDWNAVNDHYNALMKDKAYLPDDGWKRTAEPITDKSGKTIGLRATTTSPDGKSNSADYTDIGQVYEGLMPVISPQTAFEYSKHIYEQEQSAKQERAKSRYKLADDIELERVKSAGRIAEERAKALGPQGTKDYASGVLQVIRYQSENNRGFEKLPPDQQAAQAAAIYEQVLARAGQGGGQAVSTTRNLGAQAPAPAPAPAPKSIMPAFTRQNPYSLQ